MVKLKAHRVIVLPLERADKGYADGVQVREPGEQSRRQRTRNEEPSLLARAPSSSRLPASGNNSPRTSDASISLSTTGGGGGGAARRRQIAEEKRPTPPMPIYLNRRVKRPASSSSPSSKRVQSAVATGASRRPNTAKAKMVSVTSGSGLDAVESEASARSLARLSAITTVGSGGVLSSGGLARGASGRSVWGIGGGSGPAIGSTEESAMVSERKDARTRHPGPTLDGIGNGASSETLRALRGDRRSPNLVSPSICIGGREDANDTVRLKEIGVTHVLNCASQLPNAHPRDFVYERLEIIDIPEQELGSFHKPAVSFLKHVEECGGRTLVHCIAGCSRSVSMVLLHFMETHRLRLKVAYAHVRSHRMVAEPNEGFRFQLAMAEVQLFGSSSVSRDLDQCWNFYRWNAVKQSVPHYHMEERPTCGCSVG